MILHCHDGNRMAFEVLSQWLGVKQSWSVGMGVDWWNTAWEGSKTQWSACSVAFDLISLQHVKIYELRRAEGDGSYVLAAGFVGLGGGPLGIFVFLGELSTPRRTSPGCTCSVKTHFPWSLLQWGCGGRWFTMSCFSEDLGGGQLLFHVLVWVSND